jgi:2-dehydropantoate 2-reductase
VPKICVYGAGSIGCYVGGRLAATQAEVVLVGRERIAREVAEHGLRLTDLHGADVRVKPVDFQTKPAAAADADLVLVTVKSAATAEVGELLAPLIRPDAIVVSLQNGLSNADVLREHLSQTVLAGMVPFNVVNRGNGWFHQGSEGDLEVTRDDALSAYVSVFDASGLPLTQHDDMEDVLWAKLLLNLNNPINALSGVPLKEELSQRDYRRCLALAQQEALAVGAAAGRTPARLTPVPPTLIPRLMSLPDLVFRALARSVLAIDPVARSSMWEDLEAGRATEIDWINGEVVRLGAEHGVPTPVNSRLVALIREAENGGRRGWSGRELLSALR